jgi:hypothetical protein
MSNFNDLSADQQQAWRLNHFARITQQHLANRAAADQEAVLRDAQDIENRAVMAKILEENRQKAVVEAFQMRELQNRNLEADLKRQFMTASPDATEQTWLMCKADVLKNYFIERMRAEQNREQIEREIYAGYKM